jgi:hypothetical protein
MLRKPKKLQFPSTPSTTRHKFSDQDTTELNHNIVFDENTPEPLKKRRITSFVQEFWDVFCEEGVKSPLHGCELIIDTGDHPPSRYGNPTTVFMRYLSWKRQLTGYSAYATSKGTSSCPRDLTSR